MTNEQCFEAWAPISAEWTQWAKPALFTHLGAVEPIGDEDTQWDAVDASWLPASDGRTALVVDLPGPSSVTLAIALAKRGWRPVPLFNTCIGPKAVLDCAPIARMLEAGAVALATTSIDPAAPPAFVLDTARMKPKKEPQEGDLDNRWIVFPQDFPSATYLRSKGVERVVVVQEGSVEQEDLVHVLLRWRQGGLKVLSVGVREKGEPQDVVAAKPSLFRRAWYRVKAIAGLQRHDAGGFGGVVPTQSQGGGYG